jgi:hypothetical protein
LMRILMSDSMRQHTAHMWLYNLRQHEAALLRNKIKTTTTTTTRL